MSIRDQFLHEVETYLRTSGMKPTVFGLAVLNDGKFVTDLLNTDRAPSTRTIDRVRNWIAENPPKTEAAA